MSFPSRITRLLRENESADVQLSRVIGDVALGEKKFKSLYDVVKTYANKLSITFDIKFVRLLGQGTHGVAVQIDDDRVLKITTDQKEFNTCQALVGKSLPNVMEVIKVIRLKEGNVFFIEYPLYTMLSDMSTAVSRIYQSYGIPLWTLMQKITEVILHQEHEQSIHPLDDEDILHDIDEFIDTTPFFSGLIHTDTQLIAFEEIFARLMHDEPSLFFQIVWQENVDLIDFMVQIVRGVKALYDTKIAVFNDFHYDNIGYRDGEYVLIDLGAEVMSYNGSMGYQLTELAKVGHGKSI